MAAKRDAILLLCICLQQKFAIFPKNARNLEMSPDKNACVIVKYAVPRMYHMEEITRTLCYIVRNCYKL